MAHADKPVPFHLQDGDRVVLIGGTLIEREQRHGYWEAALTSRYPDQNITFRNLGWSGDTVWGESRAGFDTPREGYRRLVEGTLALKPTVIMIGYGTNESFAGAGGLPRFKEQVNKLLDDLAPAKARILLLAPLQVEEETWRGGQLARRQEELKQYTEAIREVTRTREVRFVDEFFRRHGIPASSTENGMHLTSLGYWRTSWSLLMEMGVPGRTLKLIEFDSLQPQKIQQPTLSHSPVPPGAGKWEFQADSTVIARGLKPGKYTLTIDGRPVHTTSAREWMNPGPFGQVLIQQGPSLDQAEQLRKTIVEKNQLYFHRWRPQNETYLFDFRKHEQGQNAREVPLFDPLVEKLEKEIARLRRPVPHTYQLAPDGEEKK